MAAEDIVEVPEHGFIEVYPISTRKIGVDTITAVTATQASPIWPIEDDPNRLYFVMYADAHDPWDDNEHQYATIGWGQDGTQLGIVKRRTAVGGNSRYDVRHPVIYFDLGGLPPGPWERIELCFDVAGSEEFWNADNYQLVVDYHDTFDTHDEGLGEKVTDQDFIGSDATVVNRIPMMTVTDINTSENHLDEYYVWNDPGQTNIGILALPLDDDGQFVPGGFRGIRIYLQGGAPSGDNTLIGNFWYDHYDNRESLEYTLRQSLAPVPHLRFWPGGAFAEAELTLGLTIEARPRIETPRRVLDHRARRWRDYRG